MPPKASNSKAKLTVILKFKRHTSTYVIPFDFPTKALIMIDDVKEELAKAITSSGGLSLVEEEVGIAEDDIDVPQSEFVEETIDEKDDNKVQNIDFEDIRIATPKDKSSPYDNHWIEISSDEELKKLTLTDYDIFAFGYKSDEFNIKDFTYED